MSNFCRLHGPISIACAYESCRSWSCCCAGLLRRLRISAVTVLVLSPACLFVVHILVHVNCASLVLRWSAHMRRAPAQARGDTQATETGWRRRIGRGDAPATRPAQAKGVTSIGDKQAANDGEQRVTGDRAGDGDQRRQRGAAQAHVTERRADTCASDEKTRAGNMDQHTHG